MRWRNGSQPSVSALNELLQTCLPLLASNNARLTCSCPAVRCRFPSSTCPTPNMLRTEERSAPAPAKPATETRPMTFRSVNVDSFWSYNFV